MYKITAICNIGNIDPRGRQENRRKTVAAANILCWLDTTADSAPVITPLTLNSKIVVHLKCIH